MNCVIIGAENFTREVFTLRRSVLAKVVVPIIIVLGIGMGIVLFMSLDLISKSLRSSVESHIKDVGDQAVMSVESSEKFIEKMKDSLMAQHENNLKVVVESAYEVAKHYYDLYKGGQLSESEAKKLAEEAIGSIRFDNGAGYVFVFNEKGTTIVHIEKSLVGKNLWNLQDPDGVYIVRELTKVAKEGGGFVQYKWPKPGEKEPQPKLSYAVFFDPWDWMIGSGVYIDDVKKELVKIQGDIWEDLRKTLMSVKLGKSSYPAILSADGTLIMYIDRSLEGKKVVFKDVRTGENLLEKFLQNKNKIFHYWYKKPGKEGAFEKIAYIGWIPSKKWMVLVTAYEDEVMGGVKKAMWTNIVVMIAGGVMIFLVIWLIIRSVVVKAMKKLEEFATKVGGGDLTAELDFESEDEIGRVAKEVNEMRDSLMEIVKNIKRAGKDIEEMASDMSTIAEDMSSAVDGVMQSVDKVSSMADNVAAAVEETTSSIEEVASSAQMVSKTAEELSHQSSMLKESVGQGEEALEIIVQRVKEVSNESQNAAGRVQSLTDSTKNIEEIVDTINSIAEQTNLLALNAAIEAARAGEAGKGFAVVADEIRKLAEESRRSTEQISGILSSIMEEAKSVRDITAKLVEMIEEMSGESDRISGVFKSISDQVNALDNVTNNLAASSQEQSAAAQEISAAMDNATKSVNEVVDEIDGVKEQVVSLVDQKDRLMSSSEKLVKLVRDFEQAIGKFKTE